MATYTSMLLNRIGRRSRALIQTGSMLADRLLDLQPDDAVVCLAYDRPYPEIVAVLSEARQGGLATVLITDDLEGELCAHADISVPVPRGRRGQLALHGVTLVVLEGLVLALAAAAPDTSLAALDRLETLRGKLTKPLLPR